MDGAAPTPGEPRDEGLLASRDDDEFLAHVRSLAGSASEQTDTPYVRGYIVLGRISAGTQGVVNRAVQESTSRIVAIKTLAFGSEASEKQKARAEREAELVARLSHPNIVTVYEARHLPDGSMAVVMEFVDGVPIDRWTPPGDTPAQRRRALLEAFVNVCHGVHHAHLNGVIHRDIKPDNVLVTDEGRPVVLDFGIAKAAGVRSTQTGEFAGTPAYASPEQVSGRPLEVDALTDVYSLGVLLYRLLCGAMPYELDGSLMDIARTISETAPTRPRSVAPSLSGDLDAILTCALSKAKAERYQSAAALARDIERHLKGDVIEARHASGWYLLRKAVRANRRTLGWSAALVAVATLAGIALLISANRAATLEKQGEADRKQAHLETVRARAVGELLRASIPPNDPSRPDINNTLAFRLRRLYYRLETGGFATDPELDQAVRQIWAAVYTDPGIGRGTGMVAYAEVSLRNGLVDLKIKHGQQHPEIASTMHRLAGVLRVRSRFDEAESYCASALAMRTALFGESSPEVAESRLLLAQIMLDEGREDDALALCEQIRSYFERPGVPNDEAMASIEEIEARVALSRGLGVGACEPLVRSALTRRLRGLSPDHPDVLESLRETAQVCERFPESDLAVTCAGVWGTTGDTLASAIRADTQVLARPAYFHVSPPERADRTMAIARVATLMESLLGETDPALVRVLLGLMISGWMEGDIGLKTDGVLRAIEVLSSCYGESDPRVLVCLDEATITLVLIGRHEDALPLAHRCWAIRSEIPAFARDPLVTGNTRRTLAWCLSLSGDDEAARSEYEQAIEGMVGEVGDDHHLVALARSGLAASLLSLGNTDEADALSARALDVLARSPAAYTDQIAHASYARGVVLMELGRTTEARELFERAWTTCYADYGPAFAWRRGLAMDMARLADEAGDPGGALEWRARVRGK